MLTDHQHQALDRTRHMSVTANAGAGKTTVLVRRFVEILLSGSARVHEIVAMTFTEKAASELRKKIADEISARIDHAGTGAEERARLLQARNQLASATIGTIHSFCAQVLREYPVEADVDAAFTVLEGTDRQALLQESLSEYLSLALGQKGAPRLEPVVDVIRLLGKKAFQRHLLFFLGNREKMARLLRPGGVYAPGTSDQAVLRHWDAAVGEALAPIFADNRWAAALDRVLRVASGKKAAETAEAYRSFRRSGAEGRLALLSAFVTALFTKTGTLRKEVTGSRTDLSPVEADIAFLCASYDGSSKLLLSAGDPDADAGNRSLLVATRTLLEVYLRASELYDAKKQDQGCLDFEDLQLKVRDLLASEPIARALAERYRFVMVDEFQDTNQLQYEILRLLIAEYEGANLFIVGDPKQSIYGFRSAEVEVFSRAKEDIVEERAAGEGKALALAESFRPLTQPALFVNHLFANLMGGSGSRFDIPYADLVRGRSSDAPGRVEFHLLPEEPDGGADPVARECETIARRIGELFRSGYPIHEGRQETPRPFLYRDAAILLRNRTRLRQVEHALVRCRIPYLLSGGIGFYQTQEIVDFLNYFSFLLNRDDDVALAGILRSPFFTVSDAALYEVAIHRRRGSFWQKLSAYALGPGGTRPELRRAVSILRADLALANRLSIPLLVQRIFRVTGWRGTVAGLARGEQHAANIAKLLRIAREFESRGLTTLYDFVQRLRSLVSSEEREGQASLDTAGNAVHVMTIHAAKGLEFPAVFIPFMHEKFQADKPPLIDSEIGVGCAVQRQESLDEEAVVPLYDLLKLQSRQRVEAEEKRVLYVAATRARDLLALSGRIGQGEPKRSRLRWVLESVSLDPAVVQKGLLRRDTAPLKVLANEGGALVPREVRAQLEIHVNEEIAPDPAASSRQAREAHEAVEDDGRFLGPLRGQSRGEFFSATQLRTYLECPSKYYLKYVLGLPEVSAPPAPFDEEEEPNDVIVGEAEGSLTHAVLQEIRSVDVSDEEISARVAALVQGETQLHGRDHTALSARISENVRRFTSSAIGREVLSAVETRTEFSVNARFGDDYLSGILDRLYRTADGLWHIIDYKTDGVDVRRMSARAELYRPQLAFYAVLVRKLFSQQNVRATLLFLRHAERPVEFQFTPGAMDAFEGVIAGVIAKIRSRDFARTVPSCDGCTYQKEGRCLLGEKG